MKYEAAIAILRELLATLPWNHRDRPGVVRAISVLELEDL